MQNIFIIASLIAIIIGTITDLKNRWVPDWVSFTLIAFGIGGNAILSITQQSFWPLVTSLITAGIFYTIGAALYYTGGWGGGDAKLLTGLGASLSAVNKVTIWPFSVTFLFNQFIFAVILAIIFITYTALKNKSKFEKEYLQLVKKHKIILTITTITIIIFLILFLLLKQPIIIFVLVLLGLIHLIFIFKAVETSCLFKHITPNKLVEGDWPVNPIDKIPQRKYGLTKEDIIEIKKLHSEGKLTTICVKDGMPHVPAFLIGLVYSIFFGDMMIQIIALVIN